MPGDSREARRQYGERVASFAAAHRVLEKKSGQLSAARLLTFLALTATIIAGAAALIPAPVAVAGAGLAAVLFAVLVRAHAKVRRESERCAMLSHVNAVAARRAARAWDALPSAPPIPVPPDHPYADDLALFGRASLWQLLPAVSPAPGRATMANWLLEPAAPDVVLDRQAAVAELAPKTDLRDDLAVFAVQLEGVPPAVLRAAVRLPESIAWLETEPWLIHVARALTIASIAAWLLIAAGAIPVAAGGIPLLVLGVFWGARAARFRTTFATADTLATALPWYAGIIDRLARESMDSPLLRRLGTALQGEGRDAATALRALRRILQRAEVRYSPMLHIPLQVVGLWDFHVANALANWCRRYGREIGPWFTALGETEALAALAGLHHANPGWCLPVLRDSAHPDDAAVRARALGHPLIDPDVVVTNDITVGPPGSFVLVTGSNMSGKSTLLRAVGLNAVLAQAGGPVCAETFELPPLRVHTSIRIQDSLADGVSLFMAELKRLRRVVDAAEQPLPAPKVLYLLDEMLQGTNSAERHLAARAVLARLVRSGAIGLVTTHDVSLASAPELAAVAVPVFFDESVREGADVPLSFDYRLRPGIVPAGNALKLLALVGLGNVTSPG